MVRDNANALQPLEALVCAEGNVCLIPFKRVGLGKAKKNELGQTRTRH